MSDKAKSVVGRFFKAFLAGAGASIVVTGIVSAHSFTELWSALQALGFSVFQGGLVGLFLAIQKYVTWVDEPIKRT